MSWGKLYGILFLRALVSPSLATALLRLNWRMRRRGWYAHFPFLPLPSRDYMRWRMYTVYGEQDAVPPVEDIVKFARWTSNRAP